MQTWPDEEKLRLFIEAKLSCVGLTRRDWKQLRNLQVDPSDNWRVRHLFDYEPLWVQLLSDLKLRAGYTSPAHSSDGSDEDWNSDSEESDGDLQEGDGAADMESDDDSSGDEDFEDAVEF